MASHPHRRHRRLDDPARPARRGRRHVRRPDRARASGSTTARPRRWTLPRARPPVADRRLAAACPRARAGRPAADLVALDARSCPAAYFGAMRAGLIIVPLDLRMSPDAVEGIVAASGARHLVLGTGPRRARSARGRPRAASRRRPSRRSPPTPTPPSRPTGRRSSRPGPPPAADRHLRARLHLGHDRHAEGRDARPRQRRRLDRDVPPDRARGWSTGSSRCCRCRTCSSRRSGCSTRCRSAPTSCTSGAATRGSSSMRCATTG